MAKDQLNALPAGYQLDDFTIESVLGSGGFGITYLAHERSLDRKVAIKEYLPRVAIRGEDRSSVHPISGSDTEDFEYGLKRFQDEAQTLVGFRHPNIVTVFRYLQANGTAYIVMEYVDGKSLEELLKRGGTLNESEAREVLFPLLDGIEAVHRAGFLHRDIKPGNIFVQENGAPILLDFGAARHALGAHSQSFTGIVTPGYAPFEQYSTRGNQGAWTDIYGFGATLYRAITGAKPPEATDRIEVDDYVPVAETAGPGFSPSFLAAIDASLKMRAAERPQSIAEWREMFMGNVAAAQPEAAPVTATAEPMPAAPQQQPPVAPVSPPPAASRASGRAALVILAIVIGIGVLAGGGYWGWTAYQASEKARIAAAKAKREAELARQRAEEARKLAEAEAQKRIQQEAARRRSLEAARNRAREAARRRAEVERRRGTTGGSGIQRRTYADGGRYVGRFKNGRRHGFGKYWWPNGDRYEGAWVNGVRTGRGRYWWPNRNRYVGSFRNGRLHGRGTFYWADGGRYVGNYYLGKRHGYGRMFWASGGRYAGQWRDGKRTTGTYRFPDGRSCRSSGRNCVGKAK